jgi:hypothetical protein
MKSIYKYMVLAVALLIVDTAAAQEVVTDQLIYDRVTGYMANPESVEQVAIKSNKNLQTIRWEHDITLWYGAPGFVSELLLDKVAFGCGCDIGPEPFQTGIMNMRTYTGPLYQLSTLGLSYSKQVKPWLGVGAKATFAATWQSEYDVYTNAPLYNYNMYNVAALLDFRFSWLRREKVEMYSSIGVGLMAHIERANGGLTPMVDAALVGLKIGKKFYGFIEIGAGVGGSARGGFGIRFNSKK